MVKGVNSTLEKEDGVPAGGFGDPCLIERCRALFADGTVHNLLETALLSASLIEEPTKKKRPIQRIERFSRFQWPRGL